MRKIRVKMWVLDGRPSDPVFRDATVSDEVSLEDIAARARDDIEELWGYRGARPMAESAKPRRPTEE